MTTKEQAPVSESEEKETGRLEAFSDGVFAVAITLLVLDIKVPPPEDTRNGTLINALLDQWPAYLAYLTSFLTILVMWINHHNMFQYIKKVDHTFLILNGLLLMVVTIIPFPTSLFVDYIREPDNQMIAAAIYSSTNIFLAIAFTALWVYASHHGRLLGSSIDLEKARSITRQYRFGPFLYALAFALAFINVWASFGLCLLMALFFAFPSSIFHREPQPEEESRD